MIAEQTKITPPSMVIANKTILPTQGFAPTHRPLHAVPNLDNGPASLAPNPLTNGQSAHTPVHTRTPHSIAKQLCALELTAPSLYPGIAAMWYALEETRSQILRQYLEVSAAPDGVCVAEAQSGKHTYARAQSDRAIFGGKKTFGLGRAGSPEHRAYEQRIAKRDAITEFGKFEDTARATVAGAIALAESVDLRAGLAPVEIAEENAAKESVNENFKEPEEMAVASFNPVALQGAIAPATVEEEETPAEGQVPAPISFTLCGDFYEAYGKEAEVVADFLDFVLTTRESDGYKVVGIPKYAWAKYSKQLTDAGYEINIADPEKEAAVPTEPPIIEEQAAPPLMSSVTHPQANAKGWLASLPPVVYGNVLEIMRGLRFDSDRYLEANRKAQPRYGEITIGCADIDDLIKGEGLATFLSELGKGATPPVAMESAKAMAELIVSKHNNKGTSGRVTFSETKDSLKYWEKSGHSFLEGALNTFMTWVSSWMPAEPEEEEKAPLPEEAAPPAEEPTETAAKIEEAKDTRPAHSKDGTVSDVVDSWVQEAYPDGLPVTPKRPLNEERILELMFAKTHYAKNSVSSTWSFEDLKASYKKYSGVGITPKPLKEAIAALTLSGEIEVEPTQRMGSCHPSNYHWQLTPKYLADKAATEEAMKPATQSGLNFALSEGAQALPICKHARRSESCDDLRQIAQICQAILRGAE